MFEDFLNLFFQGVTLPQQLHTTGKTIRMRVIVVFHLLLLTAAEMGAGNRMDQVLPVTQSFSVCFLEKKSFICWEGKSMPLIREDFFLFHSSQQLHCLGPGPLKGFMSCHSLLRGPLTLSYHYFRNFRDARAPSGVPC